MACGSVLAPLQNQRLPPGKGQNQSGKHPRRAEAHHHGPLVRGRHIFRSLVEGRRGNGGPFAAAGPEDFVLVSFHCHVHGVDDLHIRFLPGVHAAADNMKLSDFGIGQPEKLRRLELKLVGIVLRR